VTLVFNNAFFLAAITQHLQFREGWFCHILQCSHFSGLFVLISMPAINIYLILPYNRNAPFFTQDIFDLLLSAFILWRSWINDSWTNTSLISQFSFNIPPYLAYMPQCVGTDTMWLHAIPIGCFYLDYGYIISDLIDENIHTSTFPAMGCRGLKVQLSLGISYPIFTNTPFKLATSVNILKEMLFIPHNRAPPGSGGWWRRVPRLWPSARRVRRTVRPSSSRRGCRRPRSLPHRRSGRA